MDEDGGKDDGEADGYEEAEAEAAP